MNQRMNQRTFYRNRTRRREGHDGDVVGAHDAFVARLSGRATWRTASERRQISAKNRGLWPRSRLRRKLKIQRAEGKFGDGEQEGEIKRKREASGRRGRGEEEKPEREWKKQRGGNREKMIPRGLKMEIDAQTGVEEPAENGGARVTFGVVKPISRGRSPRRKRLGRTTIVLSILRGMEKLYGRARGRVKHAPFELMRP